MTPTRTGKGSFLASRDEIISAVELAVLVSNYKTAMEKKDHESAVHWLFKLAEHGLQNAVITIRNMLKHPEYKNAAHAYCMHAMNQGNPLACQILFDNEYRYANDQ